MSCQIHYFAGRSSRRSCRHRSGREFLCDKDSNRQGAFVWETAYDARMGRLCRAFMLSHERSASNNSHGHRTKARASFWREQYLVSRHVSSKSSSLPSASVIIESAEHYCQHILLVNNPWSDTQAIVEPMDVSCRLALSSCSRQTWYQCAAPSNTYFPCLSKILFVNKSPALLKEICSIRSMCFTAWKEGQTPFCSCLVSVMHSQLACCQEM